MYPFTVSNPSDHLIFNVGPTLGDENVAAAAANAILLGFTAAPAHTPPLIEDEEAYFKPGIQFFPVMESPSATQVLFDAVRTTSTADHFPDLPTGDDFHLSDAGLGGKSVSAITWDFGDGSPAETTDETVFGRTESATPHTFPAPGAYTVTATVDDGEGRGRSWTETVVIAP